MTRDEAKVHIASTCGDGWLPLVDRVFDALPQGSIVECVYQKWARLHFDIAPTPEAHFRTLLDEVQDSSGSTCEQCGASALECIEGGWLVALCPDHARSRHCIHLDGTPI
ncbi:MAG: hypothetical protein ACOY82_11210 [Pseudomonadota bacterium]